MCILLVAIDCLPAWPLVVLANRDEFHVRASAAAQPWRDAPDCLGGRDLVAGGSWLGQRNDGRFAAVTNLRGGAPAQALRSRGALVSEFLLGTDRVADQVARVLADLPSYGPCNLVLADAGAVWLVDGSTATSRRLPRGIHVISNGGSGAVWPKVERLREQFAASIAAGLPGDDRLFGLLADTWQPPDASLPDTGVGVEHERMLAPIFIRGDHYGTRASTVVLQHESGALSVRERGFLAGGRVGDDVAWQCQGMEAEWTLS